MQCSRNAFKNKESILEMDIWIFIREAAKKNKKKSSQQLWTISKNGEPPPPPSSQQFQPLLELENWYFLQLLRVNEGNWQKQDRRSL